MINDNQDPLPVSSLEDPAVREKVKAANVVFGLDTVSRTTEVFFGRERLKRIARSGQGEAIQAITFKLDSSTPELEYLVAAVTVLKGRCCYGAE